MPRCLAAFQITISAAAAWPARLSCNSRESGWRLPGGLGSGGAMLLSSFRCHSMTIPPDNPERKPMRMARHGAAFPPAVSSVDRRGRHRADRQGGLRSPGFTPRAQRGRPRKDSPNPVRSPGPLEPHHDGFQGQNRHARAHRPDPEDSHPPRRTARASARLACSRPGPSFARSSCGNLD
jgi:hypothetical protein